LREQLGHLAGVEEAVAHADCSSDRLDTQSPEEEKIVPKYVRVADFEGDEAALDTLVSEINSHDGPPEGVPAKAINVLTNRDAGKIRVVVFFGSEEHLRKGSETLDAMTPPEGSNMRRVSVETFEIVLQKKAP